MKLIPRILIVLLFVGILGGIIAYARGYRFNFQKGSVSPTGIIAVTSSPKAAKIYVNGHLKGVTDTSLTLPPGKYTVEIKKDGYTSWTKQFTLKGELVMVADAVLFPLNPSLTPLTNVGVTKIVPIDQTGKLLIFSQNENEEKDGIYVFDQGKRPFSLLPPLKMVVLKKYLPKGIDFSKVTVSFSPDYKEGVFEFEMENGNVAYDISFDEETKAPFEVSASKDTLLQVWTEEMKVEQTRFLETLPKDLQKTASESFRLITFSPDKNRFLYQATNAVVLPAVITPPVIAANQEPETRELTEGAWYVYDIKEDKNFLIKEGDNEGLLWYADSKHLVVNGESQTLIKEYDNTNKQVIYSGPHEQGFLDVGTDGKLLILANLNPSLNKNPDLYAVGIR